MTVYIKIKALAKRKPIIADLPCIIEGNSATSNDLIEHIVRKMVRDYNAKPIEEPLFPFLTDDKINDGAKIGKVGFAERKNESMQDEESAVENALMCFYDGIFKLFINDEEVEINYEITLKEGDEITFIRIAMLAGRMW